MAHRKKLKTGFTTGTAAAAAAKGALALIVEGESPLKVRIRLLTGDYLDIPLSSCKSEGKNRAVCTVIKDAGDDPDITHRAKIGALVFFDEKSESGEIIIRGGEGVGTITKPGLEVSQGNPAINSGPEKMITEAVSDLLSRHNKKNRVVVEIFVPEGKKLAVKTLNKRLGIIGGISILGTTGIVKPVSHEAYIATIRSSLSVALAMGVKKVVMTTGRRSERFAMEALPELPEEAFIQIGDFFKMSVEAASKMDFTFIILAVFFGKAVKQAQGVPHTHASKSELTMHKLSAWAYEITKNKKLSEDILSANTARHAFEFIVDDYPEVISHVGRLMIKSAKKFTESPMDIQSMIFDYRGGILFDSIKKGA